MYTLVFFPIVVVVMQLMLLCVTPQKYACIGDSNYLGLCDVLCFLNSI